MVASLDMDSKKAITLAIVVVVIAGIILFLESKKPRMPFFKSAKNDSALFQPKKEKAGVYPPAKELVDPQGFINTEKLSIADLIGKKVILVDFWTYSCINCQRTTPYLNAWYDKYKDQGLEIVGVHTPEFEFEKIYDNVLAATKKFGINYPVVLDSNYATWRAYRNQYWPRKYLIDIDGYIVYDHIGEGGYEETEQKIQELLKERMSKLGQRGGIMGVITKAEEKKVRVDSPEIYFGAERNESLGNGTAHLPGTQVLKKPETIRTNTLYLDGGWEMDAERARNTSREAKIVFRYRASDVYMVMRADFPTRLKVYRDGRQVEKEAGEDVRNGEMTVKEDRLYKIIHDEGGFGEHTLELIIEEPGLEAFTFTFG